MTWPFASHRESTTRARIVCLAFLLSLSAASVMAEHELETRFKTPPTGARPWVY